MSRHRTPFLGITQAPIPIAGGCSLLVSPIAGNLPLPLFGTGPGDGAVTITVGLPKPVSVGSFTAQTFVIDSGVPQGFWNSNGVLVTVQ